MSITPEAPETPALQAAPRARTTRPEHGRSHARGYLATGPGRIVAVVTVAALAIRLFTLSRPGYLTGVSEYDDGVYLGAAIRLTQGELPYRDFAFIQPPGIVVLMAPLALAAKVTTTVKVLAVARVLTALASTACVWLAGSLARYRGPIATLVTAGFLAIYPDDISAAHTLMLEPWMNLLCLLAVTAAFRDGSLARPERLQWAGLAMGLAVTVKIWAAVPAAVLLATCLLARGGDGGRRAGRGPRARRYALGLVAGAVVPIAPFALAAPRGLWASVVTDQAARIGSAVPVVERLAHVTGLIDVLNTSWHFAPGAVGARSIFADGSSAAFRPITSVAPLAYAASAIALAAIIGGYWWRARDRGLRPPRWLSPLEWFSVAAAAGACAAILGYSVFFYHYADFPAPWLALTLGGAAGALDFASPQRRLRALAVVAVALALVAGLQLREMSAASRATAQGVSREIPAGACVVADEVSLTIAANRFAGSPAGCPVIVDSLAQTLVLSHGVSIQAGAARNPRLASAWISLLGRADYVWFSPGGGARSRIPWSPVLAAWFGEHFRPVGSYSRGTGQLYKRAG